MIAGFFPYGTVACADKHQAQSPFNVDAWTDQPARLKVAIVVVVVVGDVSSSSSS